MLFQDCHPLFRLW